MGYALVFTRCINCNLRISVNPNRCPSLMVNGKREAICEGCFHKWNQIHRVNKGLEPDKLKHDAYKPCSEDELV